MRRSFILFGVVGAVGLAGLLSACGSGGSPSASASGSGSGSASASGTVTGFGSIYVNGKKFEANDVEVRHDGTTERCTISSSPSQRCGLKEGMTVKVSGNFSGLSHTASIITQEDTLEGPITSVDVANSQFQVLGQTVLVDDTTRFDSGVALNTLVTGDIIKVSGFVKSDGIVVATYIERKAGTGCGTDGCEIKGVIKNHNHATASFQIGGLTVSYDNTTTISDMPVPSGDNWNGIFAEVKGTALAGATLTATKVEPENDGVGKNDDVDEFEVEGFVTNVVSADSNTRVAHFFIGTTEVRTTSNTEFREGTVDEIVLGAKMSAEGRLENGILIAEEVKFKESARLEGDIDSVTGSTPSFTLTIKGLSNVTIKTDSLTRFDGTPTQNTHVRVRGRLNGGTTVVASRIKVESSSTDDVILQGQVQGKPDPILTILGVTVDTTGIRFEGLDDGTTSRTTFFAVMKVHETLVKVKGMLQTNGTVIWKEAELED